MTDYKNELEQILTWFIGYPRQDDVSGGFDDAMSKLEALLSKRELEAKRKGFQEATELIHGHYCLELKNWTALGDEAGIYIESWLKSYTKINAISDQLTNREEK